MAFRVAQAVVVVFTPDDEARLLPELHETDEPAYDRELTAQPRPNVLVEAGMALMSHSTRSIIIEIGQLRPVTNLGGRNTVRIASDIPRALNEIAERLKTAECPVDPTSGRWLNAERFERLAARERRATQPTPVPTSQSAPSDQAATEVISAEALARELNAHVAVAANDLLNRDDEVAAEDVNRWAGTTGITIRTRCGESWELRFLAEGRRRGFSPLDELNTKIHFIHDDLIAKVQGGWFAFGPRG